MNHILGLQLIHPTHCALPVPYGLQPTSDGLQPNSVLVTSSFLLLVVMPGATSSDALRYY